MIEFLEPTFQIFPARRLKVAGVDFLDVQDVLAFGRVLDATLESEQVLIGLLFDLDGGQLVLVREQNFEDFPTFGLGLRRGDQGAEGDGPGPELEGILSSESLGARSEAIALFDDLVELLGGEQLAQSLQLVLLIGGRSSLSVTVHGLMPAH